jgi:hypothetical protein
MTQKFSSLMALFLLSLKLSVPALANPKEEVIDTAHLSIASFNWKTLSEEETLAEYQNYLQNTPQPEVPLPDLTRPLLSTEEFQFMWLIGEKIYQVVEKGQPVLNIDTQTWSVLPKNVSEAAKLTEWKEPVRIAYRLSAKNLYGIEVIKVCYIVQFVPGGKYEGKGAYLSHISVIPSTIDVAWGYTLNIKAEAREALNAGTTENPIAAFSTDVKVEVKTLLKTSINTLTTYMTGNGKIMPAGASTIH